MSLLLDSRARTFPLKFELSAHGRFVKRIFNLPYHARVYGCINEYISSAYQVLEGFYLRSKFNFNPQIKN